MSCHDHEEGEPGDAAANATRAATALMTKRSPSLSILNGPEPLQAPLLWRSLEARAGHPDVAKAALREFPPGASEMPEDGVSRRGFIQLLGTSLAVAGGGVACYRPNQKIVPYVRSAPEMTPGNPLHFATAHPCEGFARAVVVESHAGRPTKIEGNPDQADAQGTASARDQALVLGLYDDNRAKQVRLRGEPVGWPSVVHDIAERSAKFGADGGAGLRFLVEANASPLLADLRARVLQRYPKAKFVAYSSVAADGALDGARLAFGRPLELRHDLTQAAVILALDSDFLTDGPEQLRLARQFAQGRTPGPQMNRLYVAEPCMTSTGTVADHRLRVRGSEIIAVAQALLAELGKMSGLGSLAPLAALPRAAAGAVDARWVAAAAKDLARARGRSLVIAGRRQPAAVHALANAINFALGNVGTTVTAWTPIASDVPTGVEPLRALVEEMAAGTVDTLVITAHNPVYGAPSDFKFDKLLARVPHSLYWSLYEDETAAVATTFLPAAHVLESWGDGRGLDGTVSIIQPLIAPLWSGLTEADVFAAFVDDGDKGSHELVKQLWTGRARDNAWTALGGFDPLWESWLAKGVIEKTAAQPETGLAIDGGALAGALGPLVTGGPKGDGLEIAFAVDPKVYDGRYANNAWLQELPHPVTKITWDNAVLISPTSAARYDVKTGDVVRIELGDRQVTGPVYVQPGQADESLTLALGYGRTAAALSIGKGVGFNAGSLRQSGAFWFDRGATLTRKSGGYKFGITQDHWSMEDREPAMSATLASFLKEGSDFHEKLEERRKPLPTLHAPVDYSQQAYKWAMSIDLNKCTGCNACVVACQAENNIPVVGRDNVRIGREMLWIRLDRYYSGSIEEPEVVHQPLACVHCETAPCEYVCPVNATVHSDEGLNEMVYNRCIGTRYCSNNCPYKARRFNFLDYQGEPPAVAKMVNNPDVTVRSRGVMEKCTYCVQRIERKRIDTRNEGRSITDGELQTACQQGCPSQAIEFGSLNDPNSRVSKLHQDDRRYDLLHELSTRPRTAYLARVRNPNPELA